MAHTVGVKIILKNGTQCSFSCFINLSIKSIPKWWNDFGNSELTFFRQSRQLTWSSSRRLKSSPIHSVSLSSNRKALASNSYKWAKHENKPSLLLQLSGQPKCSYWIDPESFAAVSSVETSSGAEIAGEISALLDARLQSDWYAWLQVIQDH